MLNQTKINNTVALANAFELVIMAVKASSSKAPVINADDQTDIAGAKFAEKLMGDAENVK